MREEPYGSFFIMQKDLMTITGIYKIQNTINDKIYVGQSRDIRNRWKRHVKDLNCGCHENNHLQAAWNKYGQSVFRFDLIEECSVAELDEKEQYWIAQCRALENGYNFDRGGKGCSGYKHTEDEIYKMRMAHNPIPVLEFDLSFNLIARFEGGLHQAAKLYKYTSSCIKRCCEHLGKPSYKDRYWIFESEYSHPDFSWEKYLAGEAVWKPPEKEIAIRKICQYTLDRKLVKTWDSYHDIEAAGYIRHKVSMICNQTRGAKIHGGYLWAFEGYSFEDGYFDNLKGSTCHADEIHTAKSIVKNRRKKPVIQKNSNGEIIGFFDSITEAARSISGNIQNLSTALNKRRKYYGYIWEYA